MSEINLSTLHISSNYPMYSGMNESISEPDRRSGCLERQSSYVSDSSNSSESVSHTPKKKTRRYRAEKIAGTGSFGTVYIARVVLEDDSLGARVAIKRVLQDKRYKNRELQIMRMLDHPNVITMRDECFYSTGENGSIYLNLVIDYMPDTLFSFTKQRNALEKEGIDNSWIRLFSYQLFKAAEYIHELNICHRDLKPQNVLVDTTTGCLRICDFGSAKILVPGEPNVSYICSRYYRAPELIFGAAEYTTAIDIWSLGCVIAEMILGHPIFTGSSNVDQLIAIIKIVGTPTEHEIRQMNPNYKETEFPLVKKKKLENLFLPCLDPGFVDLLDRIFVFDPSCRITATEALQHPVFDSIRGCSSYPLPNGGIYCPSSTEMD